MLMWQFDHLWHLLNPLLELCVVALKWLTNLTYMLISIFLQNHSVWQFCVLNSSLYKYITKKYKIFSFTFFSRTFYHEYFEWYVEWLLHVLKLFWWQNSVKSSQGDSHIRWYTHARARARTRTPAHPRARAPALTHAHAHAHTHTHIHTHTHTKQQCSRDQHSLHLHH